MPTPQEQKEYQDYLDYQEYSKYAAANKGASNAPTQVPTDAQSGYQPSQSPTADSINPNAQSGQGAPGSDEVGGVEKALRTGESYANGYSAGLTKPAFALAGAAGQAGHNAVFGDPDKSIMDPNGSSFGDKVQYQTDRQKQFEGENPVTSTVANVVGAVSPGSIANRAFGMAGKAIGAGVKAVTPAAQAATDVIVGNGAASSIAKNRLAGWLGRTAVDSATGAATGAGVEAAGGTANALTDRNASLAGTGEAVKNGAEFGALIPAALNVAKPATVGIARLFSKMNPKAADALVNDTSRVDDFYDKMKGRDSDPQALDTQMRASAKDASDKLNGKQDELMGKYKAQLPGKNVRVNASQMQDTGIPAVDAELARIKNLQPQKPGTMQVTLEDQIPQTREAQYMDRQQRMQSARQGSGPSPQGPNKADRLNQLINGMDNQPLAADGSPAEPGQSYGYDSSKLPAYEPSPKPDALQYDPTGSGRVNTAKNVPATPRDPNAVSQSFQYERGAPDSYTLTGEQAHNVARTAQANTRFTDQGMYGAKAVGEAKGLGMALKEGLHSVGGEGADSLSDLDSRMSGNAKLGRVFRKMTATDPTAGIGANKVSQQAVLQKMDSATGSDLYGANKALTAAKAFKPGITPAVGRQVLRTVGAAQRAGAGDKSLAAILQLINNKAGEEQ